MRSLKNFVYLNNNVKIGEEPHHTLLRRLADEQQIEPRSLPGLYWLQGMGMPRGLDHLVARGHINPKGHVEIWESNADVNKVRNRVRDAYRQPNLDWQPDAAGA